MLSDIAGQLYCRAHTHTHTHTQSHIHNTHTHNHTYTTHTHTHTIFTLRPAQVDLQCDYLSVQSFHVIFELLPFLAQQQLQFRYSKTS